LVLIVKTESAQANSLDEGAFACEVRELMAQSRLVPANDDEVGWEARRARGGDKQVDLAY